MWTLIVLSTVIGIEEPKVTRYDDYASKMECHQAWHKVTSEFTEGEVAYCKLTKPKKPIYFGESKLPKKLDTAHNLRYHSDSHLK